MAIPNIELDKKAFNRNETVLKRKIQAKSWVNDKIKCHIMGLRIK